jgi:hypothetical protein
MAQTTSPDRSDPPKQKPEAPKEMSHEEYKKLIEKQLDKNWPYVGN